MTNKIAEPVEELPTEETGLSEENQPNDKEKKEWATIKEVATFLVVSFNLQDRGNRYNFNHIEEDELHYIIACTINDYGYEVTPGMFVAKRDLYYEICNNMIDIDLTDPQFDPDPSVVKNIDRINENL